MVKYSLLDTT